MINLRRSEERGPSRLSWLDSRHTFSFGGYYDPAHMGVSVLRVLNDDSVIPGGGFATHSHQDMEIISYVLSGVIEHKDSMGNIERLPAGEFQLMSAGTGVTHSEYNPSATDGLRFLQIWIRPNELGVQPGYQQKRFPPVDGRQLVISPDGRDGTLSIKQDAFVEYIRLAAGEALPVGADNGRVQYLHVIDGRLEVDDANLEGGDGGTIFDEVVELRCIDECEALLFDLPGRDE
ncbi:MAG: pirin family protein [Gammaproteobacteria bacterium]|nr:pirin family protein [Gammaproteobacteria bacterium]MBT8443841.1 pirin family protein [Gammaproteobacteria bacterium]NND35524.1 pirin family protein [Gammaproteobacteria bacterium]